MNGNGDFFCAAGQRQTCPVCDENCTECGNRRHKWPTPEQYKEEYDAIYPHDGAVWVLDGEWTLMQYQEYKSSWAENSTMMAHNVKPGKTVPFVVCSCAPYGKPDTDWRPK